ncbi:alanine--tRNA ligase [Micromonospora yangpuensis]|uniref:Alanine--tRNA ligase n=1 Tax=Micromonospora yangpuensis TaxID=683228 RepID=A0A1C6UWN4_9ACTN|nr:alanine--tRNA ligase [Micromonospora yangpuensis]GGM25058.1 alanine--tRNA ligase [Micromonospora yangpuensis]SCL58502.1 alanyl-tRNA synthetase [Micromonospora yangpuensis]
MRTAEIKRRFLAHFEANGHTAVPSAPLPAISDPNLLFINAGMVQFVPYFLGQRAAPYPRATSVQKCIRTPDIDEVGKTSRHGTFFQMNGNFSFGDYFKAGAIPLAWELSTTPVERGGFGLDPQRIWATVYLDDDEAYDLWIATGVPAERIMRRGKKDNFWSMGIPGPAGPCSELYYDRGPAYGAEGGPEVDEDRYLEFWNLVFMQYEIADVASKEDFRIVGELPRKNIDTGMGLERMASILQGVDNLYEIDEVRPILTRAAELTGRRYGTHSGPAASQSHPDDVRLRVVADHVRTALMLIGDGVTPGNEGRGYVLRRIMRRAVRAMRLLGWQDRALPELLPVARDCMAPSYPELTDGFDRIATVAYAEEETFLGTLRAGTTILDTAIAETKRAGRSALPADKAFQLHDTYGFPIDLTLEIADEQGLQVDADGFRALMSEQRARAKADAKARKTGHADLTAYRTVLDAHGPTDWLAYETLDTRSRVLAIWVAGRPVDTATTGDIVTVALDRTPFYAESGGQHADAGTLTGPNLRAEVVDVQRPVRGLVAHTVRVLDGGLTVGDDLHAAVDPEWRTGARQAHSGTHVVHAALRQVLGPTALQSGSYNRPGYLRLDFAWRGGLTEATRSEIEEVANLAIRRDLPVGVRYVSLEQARAEGALALFGETYDETVRVVEIGGEWSRELCGGTHVAHAAQIGSLALTGESSVGAGQRRVEAVTGIEAFRYLARERDLVQQLAAQLKARPEELPDRVSALLARMKQLERDGDDLRGRLVDLDADTHASNAVDIHGVAYVGVTTTVDARRLAERIRDRLGRRPGVVAVVAGTSIVVTLTPAGTERGLAANTLIKELLAGKGGGNTASAQGKAGGNPTDLLDRLRNLIRPT